MKDRILAAIEQFMSIGYAYVTSTTLSGTVGARPDVVEAALRDLHAERRVVICSKGWALPAKTLMTFRKTGNLPEPLIRLAAAIRNGNPDMTLSDLARRSGVARKKIRLALDELTRRKIIIERADGWYE